jgi:hypothetical protein
MQCTQREKELEGILKGEGERCMVGEARETAGPSQACKQGVIRFIVSANILKLT